MNHLTALLWLMVILLYFWEIVLEKKSETITIIQNDKKSSLETYKHKQIYGNIIALVFYGRESSVSILFKYLEKNLKSNGGVLDKIVFAIKTNKTQDIKFLDKYLEFKSTNEYERNNFGAYNKDYKRLYENLHENDLVFKIDDDVVFIADGTFEKMIEEYLKKI